MGNDNSYDSTLLDFTNQVVFTTSEQAKEKKVAAQKAEQLQKTWEKLNFYLKKTWPLHVLDVLTKEAEIFQETLVEGINTKKLIITLLEETKEQAKGIFLEYPRRLELDCNLKNLEIDKTSRHPQYTFEQGFIRLEIDSKKGLATIKNYVSSLPRFPADIEAVVEKIISEKSRLFDRFLDESKFMENLYKKYLEEVSYQKMHEGAGIPIRKITDRMSKEDKTFKLDEFLVDLSKLVQQNQAQLKGKKVELQQTKDEKQGLLLHLKPSRGYFEFIKFV